jgi:hypothetical protein
MYSDSIIERFWSKVEVRGEDECWEWQGARNSDGYGNMAISKGKWDKGHRISYLLHYGDIPNGQCVCHTCDNRSCCNPRHLWLGTHLENMDDMTRKKRAWGTKLNEEDVRQMRVLVENGLSQVEVGEMFSISHAQVNRIINRKCWKLVP